MNRSTLIGIELFGMVLAGIVWLLQKPDMTTNRTQAPAESTQSAPAAQLSKPRAAMTPGDLAFHWEIGERAQYDYQLDSQIKVNSAISQENIQWQQTHLQFRGILNMRVFERPGESLYLGFQLSPLDVNMNGQTLSELSQLYSVFFMTEVSPQGQFKQYYFPAYLKNAEEQTPLSELVSLAQIVLPEKQPDMNVWQAEEQHGTGLYKAAYQLQKHSIHKQKVAYQKVSSLTRSAWRDVDLNIKVVDSEVEAELAPQQSWLNSISLRETLQFNLERNRLSDANYHLSIKRSPASINQNLLIHQLPDDPERVKAHLASMGTLDSDTGVTTWEAMRRQRLRERFANTNFEELLTQVIDAHNNDEDISAYGRALSQYLKVHPEASQVLAEQLKQSDYNHAISATLINALGNAGHPEAQQALLDIASDERPQALVQVRQATVSAGSIVQPEGFLLDGLWQQVHNNAREYDTALLALGRLSNTLRGQGNEANAQTITQQLSDYLQQSTLSPRNQLLALKSLSNTDNDSIYPVVEPYLNAENIPVRAAAYQALSNFEDDQSRQVLLSGLNQDDSSVIRQTAFNAIRQRTDQDYPEVIQQVAAQLPEETDGDLKMQLIHFLGQHKDADPSITPLLQQQLTLEQPSREVLKALYKAIYEPVPNE
ncbi:MAG: HEAT repeat domain-containing protein [Pseudomonadota bacterium]